MLIHSVKRAAGVSLSAHVHTDPESEHNTNPWGGTMSVWVWTTTLWEYGSGRTYGLGLCVGRFLILTQMSLLSRGLLKRCISSWGSFNTSQLPGTCPFIWAVYFVSMSAAVAPLVTGGAKVSFTTEFSTAPFYSVGFCFLYFVALLLGRIHFSVLPLPAKLITLSL